MLHYLKSKLKNKYVLVFSLISYQNVNTPLYAPTRKSIVLKCKIKSIWFQADQIICSQIFHI